MNMLDGLKVSFDGYLGQETGVIVHSQMIDKEYETTYQFVIMDRKGRLHIRRSHKVIFFKKDKDMIFNKPMEVISKVAQAERADSVEKRTDILDIR